MLWKSFCAMCLMLIPAITCPAQVTVSEYAIPTTGSNPQIITAGPDGNVWFTEYFVNQVALITPAGVVTEFPLPPYSDPMFGRSNFPYGITAGADGNLWFTEDVSSKIGRITPTGVITEFPLPIANSNPHGITAGPDGNLWFTEDGNGGKIARITPAGVITEFQIPSISAFPFSEPVGITTGPDGNLWFAEENGNQIGRITPAGVITEFPVPTSASQPQGITPGPDGNLWFTESVGNKIGRITPGGVITEFALQVASEPIGITAGPDGAVWFTEVAANKIGRITPTGVITEFPVPTAGSNPIWITPGPDGNLWFTEESGNKIGKVSLCSAPVITALVATPNVLWPPDRRMVHVSLTGSTSGGCGAVSCKIVSVSSNEPVDADDEDWIITGDLTLDLRASRSGNNRERIYTVTVECRDSGNNTATKTIDVIVPDYREHESSEGEKFHRRNHEHRPRQEDKVDY